MKKQVNIRMAPSTKSKLEKLIATTGMLQTEVISVAIDRMYKEEIKMDTDFEQEDKKIYKLVETQADDLGEWGNDLSDDQVASIVESYDEIQLKALKKYFPVIDFETVNPGQVFQAQSHNSDLYESDEIHDVITKCFDEWILQALKENGI